MIDLVEIEEHKTIMEVRTETMKHTIGWREWITMNDVQPLSSPIIFLNNDSIISQQQCFIIQKI